MFKKILLATDGSPAIERGVLYAGHVARVEGAEIVVIHVYEPPERYANFAGYNELLENYRKVAQSLVDEIVQQLRDDGAQVRGETAMGVPAEAIIQAANAYDIDIIIMGTRGSSNLKDILGSVSMQVLRRARCPVLQIP